MDLGISLKEIVETFSAGINEEQGWAVLHQALRHHRCLQGSITTTPASGNALSDGRIICPDIGNLRLDKDGAVAVVNGPGAEVEKCGGFVCELINQSMLREYVTLHESFKTTFS